MIFCVNHELYFSFGQRQIVTDCCQINVGRSSLSSVEALTVCSSVELNMTFWQISDKERIPKPRLHKFSAKRRLIQGKCGRKLETTLNFSFFIQVWAKMQSSLSLFSILKTLPAVR